MSGEDPINKLHRNRINSIPSMGDSGPANTFSRSDFLLGKSPVNYGSGQHPNVLTGSQPSTDPRMWPKLWPRAGSILSVPKVVILSDFIAWPEFWSKCVFDFPSDVVGEDSQGVFGNYYYLDQWNLTPVWKTNNAPGSDNNEYRYSRTVATVTNPSYIQHQKLWKIFREAKRILESLDDPIYVILPNWIPFSEYEVYTTHHWEAWKNDDLYWPGNGQAMTDVIHGHSGCDIFFDGTNRARTRPDPSAPAWRSDSDSPPIVPPLLSGTPYFGTNVLHIWIGHFARNWGSPQHISYETFPLSPGGIQIGSDIQGTYLGSPISEFDGRRAVWRDTGLNYGYTGPSPVSSLLSHFSGAIDSAISDYKTNFWKYRNFGVRLFPFTDDWSIGWGPDAIVQDQKWCAAQAFYFGFTFDQFQALVTTEDQYAIDYSAETNGLKFANTIARTPISPAIRQAVTHFFPPIASRVEAYYSDSTTGLNGGTAAFMKGLIARGSLEDYNVKWEGDNGFADVFSVDGLVEYVINYFAAPLGDPP